MSDMSVSEEMKRQLSRERQAVARLGDQIGYGNMMSLASEIWGVSLHIKGLPGGEFVVGPCKALTEPCGCGGSKDCDWCCASGWLTRKVKEIKEASGG